MAKHSAPGRAIRLIRGGLSLVCALALLTGCAWTMSPDRSKRISDCLAQCDALDGRAAAPDSSANQGYWGTRDRRTTCEKKCHEK